MTICVVGDVRPELAKPHGRPQKEGADILHMFSNTRLHAAQLFEQVESLTRGGQLQQHDQGNPRRYQRGLELLLQAENEANHLIDDVKRAISQHDLRGDDLKKEAAAMRESRDQVAADGGTELAVFTSTRKGKGRATSEHYESEDEDQEESSDENGAARLDDLPGTPAGIEHASKRRALVQRLRECNLTLHKVKFLQGDVYHVLGAAHAAAEDAAYASAERLRRDLLKCEPLTSIFRVIIDTFWGRYGGSRASGNVASGAQICGQECH